MAPNCQRGLQTIKDCLERSGRKTAHRLWERNGNRYVRLWGGLRLVKERADMPTLEFEGKQFIYTHHLSVPFRELKVDAAKSLPGPGRMPSLDDNLEVLKALRPMSNCCAASKRKAWALPRAGLVRDRGDALSASIMKNNFSESCFLYCPFKFLGMDSFHRRSSNFNCNADGIASMSNTPASS